VIVAKLRGGLGNQLFIYAAGRSLALKHDVPLIFDTSWYKTGKRKLLLEEFTIAGTLVASDLSGADDGIGYNQEEWGFYEHFFACAGNKFLSGWWQSEKFFLHAAETIRKDLTFRNSLVLRQAQESLGKLRRSDHDSVVALHVRRGDYVAHSQTGRFRLLPASYYQSAMDEFEGNPLYLFFSDDTAWCHEHFQGPSVKICSEDDPLKSFALMSLCDHFVIANSTFSWWGAWLGESKTTRIYTPAHNSWFGPAKADYRTEDIIPERWRSLPIG